MTALRNLRVRRGFAATAFITVGLTAGLNLLAVTAQAEPPATTTAARFSTPGEACVFDAPTGMDLSHTGQTLIGHVGWGYQVPGTNQYIFGATETIKSTNPLTLNTSKVVWHDQGSRGKMFMTFRSGSHLGGPGYYRSAECATITNSSVTSASNAVKDVENNHYSLVQLPLFWKGNCMDDTYEILTAYGAKLPSPKWPVSDWFPNDWFVAIDWIGMSL